MKQLRTVLSTAVLLAGAALTIRLAHAQPKPIAIGPTVDARVAALEQQVATLQAQNAQLLGAIQIGADGSVTIKSPSSINLKSQTTLKIQGVQVLIN